MRNLSSQLEKFKPSFRRFFLHVTLSTFLGSLYHIFLPTFFEVKAGSKVASCSSCGFRLGCPPPASLFTSSTNSLMPIGARLCRHNPAGVSPAGYGTTPAPQSGRYPRHHSSNIESRRLLARAYAPPSAPHHGSGAWGATTGARLPVTKNSPFLFQTKLSPLLEFVEFAPSVLHKVKDLGNTESYKKNSHTIMLHVVAGLLFLCKRLLGVGADEQSLAAGYFIV